MPNSKMQAALTQAAELIMNRAKVNASWSTGAEGADRGIQSIPSAMSVGNYQENGPRYSIDIIVDGKKAPHARAFEFGSGIHKPGGSEDTKYLIVPINTRALKFPFTLTFMPGNKFIGLLSGGKVYQRKEVAKMLMSGAGMVSGEMLWNKIEHPGVEARPYMRPAVRTEIPNVRQIIGQAFTVEVIGGSIKEVFSG